MLKRRIFESIKVVSLTDGALDALPEKQISEYTLSRDIDVLDLDSLDEKPTVFVCKPLMRNYQDTAYNPMPSDMFRLFCAHVTRIDNAGDMQLSWDTKGDEHSLVNSDENWQQLSKEVVMEVGGVIIQTASRDGDNVPFTPLGTSSLDRRVRSRALHAMKAERLARTKETVSE